MAGWYLDLTERLYHYNKITYESIDTIADNLNYLDMFRL